MLSRGIKGNRNVLCQLHLPDVEEPLAIDIDEAHVVTFKSGYYLTVGLLDDLTFEVVFWLVPIASNHNSCFQSVLFISVVYISHYLMMHSAEQSVSEDVILVVVLDLSSVSELNQLVASDGQRDGVEVGLDTEERVARPPVAHARTLYEHVRDWWMMAYLFHEYARTVSLRCLVCLTKNRIERLVPSVTRIQVTHRGDYHVLQPFNRIFGLRSCVEIRAARTGYRGDDL